jgi:hypothetical protein
MMTVASISATRACPAARSMSPARAAAMAAGTTRVIRQVGQVSTGPRTAASASSTAARESAAVIRVP